MSESEWPVGSRGIWVLAGLGILTALLILVRFIHLNGFWVDELYTLHAIRLPWQEMVVERLRRGHFPGYFALVKLIYMPLQAYSAETVLRSFSILAWIAAVVSYAAFARRFASAHSFGLALLLLALNGVAIRQAGEARMYTLVLLLAVWITRCYFELLSGGDHRRWAIGLVIATVAGFAVSASTALLSVALVYDALRRRRSDPVLLKATIAALVCGAVVFVPGAIMHLETRQRLGIVGSKTSSLLAHPITLFAGVQVEDNYFDPTKLLRVLQVIGAGVTVYVLVKLWRMRKTFNTTQQAAARIVLAPFAVIALTELLADWTHFTLLGPPRYLTCMLPAAALLTSTAFEGKLRGTKTQFAVTAAACLFLVANAYAITTVTTDGTAFRNRVRWMQSEWYRAGDGVVVIPYEAADGVEMYAPGVHVDVAINRYDLDVKKLAGQLAPLRNRPRVLLVYYRPLESPILQVADAVFGPATSDRPKKPIGSLRIFRFNPELAGIEDQ